MLLLSKVLDRLAIIGDRLRGIDVRLTMDCDRAGIDSKTSSGYAPSGDRYLVSVLEALNITKTDSVIDVGCGKGSAMLTMLRFPFRQVDGLEVSHELAQIGRNNLCRVGAFRSRIIECDAYWFTGYGEYNVVYFYNPFVASVMGRVIDHIAYCVRSVGRKVTLIYNNPICHEVVMASGVFQKVAEYPNKWGTGIYVYAN